MNMLKKGPELKMPPLKVPDFLLDLFYDLKERHLLPLVAILLVALVALPIVLSSGSDSEPAEPETAVAIPSSIHSSKLVVAKAAPGLREYRRRLAGAPKDPFEQQYTESTGEEGVGSTSSGEGSTTESSESSSEGSAGATPGEGGSPSEGGEPPEGGHLQYYSFAIDVRITPVSSKKNKPDSTVRHKLPEMTMLPSRAVPALTFVGVTKDEKNAVMLVSDKVTGLFGDGTCIEGSERCQLLALQPGLPETVVYGADARTYRIELLDLRLLKTEELNVAPLGPSKKKTRNSQSEERPMQAQSVDLVSAP